MQPVKRQPISLLRTANGFELRNMIGERVIRLRDRVKQYFILNIVLPILIYIFINVFLFFTDYFERKHS